ncbi:hypothetical protein T439DRAFT_322661 [Meredithblackwellia eburnea MCA 4105]
MPTEFEVPLLDDEGAISPKFEAALAKIFRRYASPTKSKPTSTATTEKPSIVRDVSLSKSVEEDSNKEDDESVDALFDNCLSMSREDLERFSSDTNGQSMTDETYTEITEFFDIVEGDRLTFKGFLQLYQLQTENDEEETARDLTSWGFDKNLELVATRKEQDGVVEEGEPVPKEELTGNGQGGERKSESENAKSEENDGTD